MKKFKDQYQIKTTRLEGYDYSKKGMYFVTICTKDRDEYFGRIVNGKMIYSDMGKVAEMCWRQIPEHFPFVRLDVFVIMPNHVHGIVEIFHDNHYPTLVETQHFASLDREQKNNKNKFGPQSNNLASIIPGFKSGVKKYATIHDVRFAWQPRFYDHIIRNEKSLHEIREYVINNPIMWEKEENHVQ